MTESPAHLAARGQRDHLRAVTPGGRSSEVERLVALGAQWRWDDVGEVPGVDRTALADPEGNLFCLAEHHDALEDAAG